LEEERKNLARLFLKEFKGIATHGRGIDIVNRRKNLESLAELGLTRRNCVDEILNLSATDYCGGPEPDTDRPGEIWEFGKTILGKQVYIKLKIAQAGNEKLAKCISFHIAEFPLCFPFKGGSNEERGKIS